MNLLHYFHPNPIFFQIGGLKIHYYGLIIVLAVFSGLWILTSLAKKKNLRLDDIQDLFFWVVVIGILGARLYQVFVLNWNYYQNNLWAIFKIWEGGLAIHGAIILGLATLLVWSRKKKINFLRILDIGVPVLALGQALGRWGNYFNQELFGKPVSWGIPIDLANRPRGFESYGFFHPTFLYESILDFILFLILLFLVRKGVKTGIPTLVYFLGYGLIRFSMEFIRIDSTLLVLGFRFPQIVSLILIIMAIILFWPILHKKNI